MASAGCSQVWSCSQMPVPLKTSTSARRHHTAHGTTRKLVCASQSSCSFNASCRRRAPTCVDAQATHRRFALNALLEGALQYSVPLTWSEKQKSSFTADGLRRHLRAVQQHGRVGLLRSSIRAGSSTAGGEAKQRVTKVQQLRQLLDGPGIVQGPACHDALSAHLIERAGFKLAFMSGFSVSATRLAAPDAGLISYGEMVEQARLIASATSLPVIGDGDTGYGNAMNVKRTVQGYAQAGMAGILIEDQVSPKACGHTKGRKVVSREEAVLRIRAAADARDEGDHDIVIVARTDARQAVNLSEALWRAQAFADQGADVVFIDALASKAEMQELCRALPGTPKMANMLEGGGKSPIMSPLELQELGFKLVAYPLLLLGVSIRAMEDALKALKTGRMPPPSLLPTFDEVKEVVGFDDYYREEERYASLPPPKPRSKPASSTSTPVVESNSQPTDKPREGSRKRGSAPTVEAPKQRPSWSGPPPPSTDEIAKRRAEWGLGASTSTPSTPNPTSSSNSSQIAPSGEKSTESPYTESSSEGARDSSSSGANSGVDSVRRLDGSRPGEPTAAEAALKAAEEAAAEALREAERVVAAAKRSAGTASEEPPKPEAVEAQAVEIKTADGWKDLAEEESSGGLRSEMRGLPGLWGRLIRVRILGLNGEKKLEFNVPAGFLDGLSNSVPAVAGLDLRAMLEESLAQRRATNSSGAIVDVESGEDRIQIFLD